MRASTCIRSRRTGLVGLIIVAVALLGLLGFSPTSAYALATENTAQQFGNIVVFVQFSDTDGNFMSDSTRVSKIVAHFANDSTSKRSLHGYLDAISYGQFSVESYLPQYDSAAGTITPVTLDRTYQSYVDENNSYTLLHDANIKLSEAGYASSVADADADTDGDGYADNVIYIFDRGTGESDRGSILHSHKEDYAGDSSSFGKQVQTVNVVTADVVFDSLDGFGTINHEFLHSIGYPDLYKESGTYDPVGRWDLMASASNFMQFPLAYLRSTKYTQSPGWLTIETIDTTTAGVTLRPAEQSSGNQAFILKSPLSSSEFFVVEYRKQAKLVLDSTQLGFDALDMKVPGSGLIVYRVNTLVQNLSNRAGTADGIYVFREAETGVTTTDGLNASFFSAESGRTAIGSTDLSVTDGALTFSDGSNSGIYIHDVGSAGDTISFDVDFADTTDAGVWESVAKTDVASVASTAISTAVDGTTVYAAYDKMDADEKSTLVVASSVDGGAWTVLGAALPSYYQGAQVCVYGGVPYVSYVSCVDSSVYKTQLYKYVSGSWTKVKQFGTDDSYVNSALVAGSDGVYLAYGDNDTGLVNNVHVVRVDAAGSSTELYSETSSKVYGSQLHLCADGSTVYFSCRNGDTPVIVQIDSGGAKALSVPSGLSGLGDVSVAASDGHLFASTSATGGVKLWEYSSSAWTQLGDSLTSNGAYAISLAASHGEPFVLVARQDESAKNTVVMRYVDGVWTQEGLAVDSGQAGSAQLVASGTSLYAGVTSPRANDESYPVVKTKTVSFGQATDIKDATVTAANQTYTGSGLTPEPVVSMGGTTLVKGSDYSLVYSNNLNVGTATVTIIGKGDYTGTAQATFSITARPITSVLLDKASYVYTGAAIEPAVTVTSDLGTVPTSGYSVKLKNNTDIGTAKVTITGKGNYSGEKTIDFAITARDISSATVKAVAAQVYTGKAITPKPVVTYGGKTLIEGTDYELSYANNTNEGTAVITIKGKGTFTGSTSVKFTIATRTISSVSLAYSTHDYTGSALRPAVTVKSAFGTVPASGYTVRYANNTNRGTAMVTVTGTGLYSGTKTVTFKITPAVKRLAGNTALDTMKAATGEGWAAGSCKTVIVATMDGYWDALSASALAGLSTNGCPVLMTSSTSLSSQTGSEIRRLGATKVYIAGGTAAVSTKVESSIKALGCSTERLAGSNAVGTSVRVYEEGKGSWGTTAIVATNDGYWDALAASPYAYAKHAPIFLYNAGTKRLDSSVVSAIKAGGFKQVLVCGGTAAVSDAAVQQLKAVGVTVTRLGGATAVDTSARIAQRCLDDGISANGVGVATVDGYWDALTGAALCGRSNAPLVLASDSNRTAITGFVASRRSQVSRAYVFGGNAAVSQGTYGALVSVLK